MENQSTALSMEYKVDFNNGDGKRKPKKEPAASKATTPQIPRITKLLALAHHLQELLDQGVVKDYADIARLSGLSRARVTQIMNLTLLAPEIQEEVLSPYTTTSSLLKKQNLRMLLKTAVWKEQIKLWQNFKAYRQTLITKE